MARDDWLFDDGRRTVATERFYTKAGEMIFRDGFDAFNVDALASATHCSRATVYRYVGGKKQIRDAVLSRAAARIVAAVRDGVHGLTGHDRVLTAIEIAVDRIRSDPAGHLFIESARGVNGSTWITESPAVAGFAAELTGIAGDDRHAAQWIARVVLSLLFWPGETARAERDVLERFVAPAFQVAGTTGGRQR